MGYSLFYVDKKELEPLFGRTVLLDNGNVVVLVRNDLPCIIDKHVLMHELYHADQYEKYGNKDCALKAELKANWYCLKNDPVGWFITFIVTIINYKRIMHMVKRYIFNDKKY